MDSEEEDWDTAGDVAMTTAEELKQMAEQRRQEEEARRDTAVKREERNREYAVVQRKLQEQKEEENEDLSGLTPFELRKKLLTKRRKAIYEQLTEEQKDRYSNYIKCAFPKSSIKKIMLNVMTTSKLADPPAIIMAGIVKLFVGDIVERSLVVMGERGDDGPIRPVHMREAYRRLKRDGKLPKKRTRSLLRR